MANATLGVNPLLSMLLAGGYPPSIPARLAWIGSLDPILFGPAEPGSNPDTFWDYSWAYRAQEARYIRDCGRTACGQTLPPLC